MDERGLCVHTFLRLNSNWASSRDVSFDLRIYFSCPKGLRAFGLWTFYTLITSQAQAEESGDSTMLRSRPIRFLFMCVLGSYFVSIIVDSWRKLQKGEIGISLERIREELVEVSSIISYLFKS